MNQNKKIIYLDHSATTPVDKRVLKAMLPYFSLNFGNPSSIHQFGQTAMAGVDQARQNIARFLNCSAEEIIFTSGATEADNLAIIGLIRALQRSGLSQPHLITSSIEHPAVLEPAKALAKQGVDITFLPVNAKAVVEVEKFKQAIQANTVLVSLMYVNSEVGSIQPIRQIGGIIKKINERRFREWQKIQPAKRPAKPPTIYFHVDAVQAVNFLNCDVKYLRADLLSLSGHKIYGPKGIGALYVKTGVPIEAVQIGGHQENNRRSGTLNVPGIVGLGAAVKLLSKTDLEKNNRQLAGLREQLVKGIKKSVPGAKLNTDLNNSTPSHAHFSFAGAEGEAILISLDLAGLAVSTGSACASGSLRASHVLLAMGISEEVAHSSIRFTLGKNNTAAEIKKVLLILPPIIKKLRRMAPRL